MSEDESYLTRHEQASRTKDRIFTAAINLFNEKGFQNVTIRDICRSAQVANGTFYLHYKSKHDILYSVYQKADEIYERELISKRDDIHAIEKILELIRIQLSTATVFHVQSESVKQLYIYQLESDNQYFLSEDREFYEQLSIVVEDGIKKEELRSDVAVSVICWRILRFSRGIIFDWCLHNCSYDLIQFGLEEVAFYLESFRKNTP